LIYTSRDKLKSQWWSIQMLKLQNNLKLFSCMFFNGASNVEPLISIYRVFWALVAVGGWPMVLCHVPWAPLDFTWKSGWTFWPSECCCVLQNVDVHHDFHLSSSFMSVWWVYGFIQCVPYDFLGIIHVLWLLHKHHNVAWIKLFQICNELCAGEKIVVLQFQAHASRRFAW